MPGGACPGIALATPDGGWGIKTPGGI